MRALNFGFVLQITYNLPRRFTIWQSAWRFFADFSDDNIFMAVIQFQVKVIWQARSGHIPFQARDNNLARDYDQCLIRENVLFMYFH